MNAKPRYLPMVMVYAGVALTAAPLCLAASFPQIPLWIAVTVGTAFGGPTLAVGIWLQTKSEPSPDRTEASRGPHSERATFKGDALAIATLAILVCAPALLLSPLLLVPPGDAWPLVMVRLSLVGAFLVVLRCWIDRAFCFVQQRFRGWASDGLLNALSDPAREEPSGAIAAAMANWQLLGVAAVAFFVASGAVAFDSPLTRLDGASRYRRIVTVVQWCRSNPNTICSSSLLIGSGATAIFVARIRRSWRRRPAEPHSRAGGSLPQAR